MARLDRLLDRSTVGTRHLVAALAVVAFVRGLVMFFVLDARLVPDTAIYAQGGFGLFPSPVGRALGAFGAGPLAVANAAGAAVMVLAAAALAHRCGGRPWLAALLVTVAPLGLWGMFASVDALGAALVAAGLWAYLEERRRAAYGLMALACATHLAVVPLVAAWALVGLRARARLVVLGSTVLLSAAVLVLTPYGGIVSAVATPATVLAVGLATAGIVALTFLPAAPWVLRRNPLRRQTVALLVGVVVAAGVVGAAERRSNSRYALPLVPVLSAAAAIPRRVWA